MNLISKSKTIFILLLLSAFCQSCTSNSNTPIMTIDSSSLGLVPLPQSVQLAKGSFSLEGAGVACKDDGVCDYLLQRIETLSGWKLNQNGEGSIKLDIDPKLDTGPEGYSISVSSDEVLLRGNSDAGLFYAIQTFLQLLPQDGAKTISAVDIFDEPRFPYRGMMLDVSRHYFSVGQIKRQLDLMAAHKLNKFHWHLTDDQGWRIEIKKYPKLVDVASRRKSTTLLVKPFSHDVKDGNPYEGHYAHDDVREVVRYAASRHITVIPEIEMPGHAQAAMAAYPWLGCTDEPIEVSNNWGVHEAGVVCPSEETFEFYENVLLEVMELFPSKYIHVGADEAPNDVWEKSELAQSVIKREGLKDENELQSYFIKRMEKFLNSHGRSLIGWDEILEGGLAPEATVMSWRGTEGGIAAAQQGHDVIMTPTTHAYLDYRQGDKETEPLAIGDSFLALETVYSFEPVPEVLNAKQSKHILGTQANVWTEYINNQDYLDYMIYPRLTAVAENAWTNPDLKNYESFLERLTRHYDRLDRDGVKYRKHER